jgi:hypothetical protein
MPRTTIDTPEGWPIGGLPLASRTIILDPNVDLDKLDVVIGAKL